MLIPSRAPIVTGWRRLCSDRDQSRACCQHKVVEAADIVRCMRGWPHDRVREYCQDRGWKVQIVPDAASISGTLREGLVEC
jgi:hypothetical protein